MVQLNHLTITAGSGYTDGTYYAAVYGDGTSQGTSSGAIIRITVSSGAIASFGLTAGTDTTIHAAGAAYTFGYVNLGAGYTFSDSGLTSASNMVVVLVEQSMWLSVQMMVMVITQ